MADLVIRGMAKMPGNCLECMFAGFGGMRHELNVCMFSGESQSLLSYERMSKCPLVPLPAGHGRLIDADALLDESCDVIEDHSGLDYVDPCPMWGYSADMIAHAPTIVPAEGGGEDG